MAEADHGGRLRGQPDRRRYLHRPALAPAPKRLARVDAPVQLCHRRRRRHPARRVSGTKGRGAARPVGERAPPGAEQAQSRRRAGARAEGQNSIPNPVARWAGQRFGRMRACSRPSAAATRTAAALPAADAMPWLRTFRRSCSRTTTGPKRRRSSWPSTPWSGHPPWPPSSRGAKLSTTPTDATSTWRPTVPPAPSLALPSCCPM